MHETEVCMCCNSVFSADNTRHNFVCENCNLKWIEYQQRQNKYKKAFEEIAFHLLEDSPTVQNIRDAKDTVNRILEEEEN